MPYQGRLPAKYPDTNYKYTLEQGSVSAPTLSFLNDSNNGLWSPATDNIAISTNGVERLRITDTGKLGIGGVPSLPVDITYSDTTAYTTNSGVNGVRLINYSPGSAGIFTSLMLQANGSFVGAAQAIISLIQDTITNATGHLAFSTRHNASLTEKVRITSTGNVGIGTTNPSYKLQVTGGSTGSHFAIGDASARLVLDYRVVSTTNPCPTITSDGEGLHYLGTNGNANSAHYFYSGTGTNAETFRITPSGQIAVASTRGGSAGAPAISKSDDLNTGIFFPADDTLAFAEGGAEVLRIDSAGNVGIGTTNPTVKLNPFVPGVGGVAVPFRVSASGNGGSGRGVGISFGAPGSASSVEVARIDGRQNAASATADNASMNFMVANSSGTLTEYARIDNTGRFGINGTSTLAGRLHISTFNETSILLERGGDTWSTNDYHEIVSRGTTGGNARVFSRVRTTVIQPVGSSSASVLQFYTNNGSTDFEAARIDNSGALLLGTTTSGVFRLHSNYGTTLTQNTSPVLNQISANSFDNLGTGNPVLLRLFVGMGATPTGTLLEAFSSTSSGPRFFITAQHQTGTAIRTDKPNVSVEFGDAWSTSNAGRSIFLLHNISYINGPLGDGCTSLCASSVTLKPTWGGGTPTNRNANAYEATIAANNPSAVSTAYFANVTGAASNWAFYSSNGDSYFSGSVGIGSTSLSTNAKRLYLYQVTDTDNTVPTMSIYRATGSGGGSGSMEVGLNVNIPFCFNNNSTTGIKVYTGTGLENTSYAIDAEVSKANNGTYRAARFTGGQGNIAGYGSQNVVDIIAGIAGTGVHGKVIGLAISNPNYDYTGGDGNNVGIRLLDATTASVTHNAVEFYRNNVRVGTITTTLSATAYNISSDYRLKENVVPLQNAIDRLKQIPVHRFNFISTPEVTVDGFLAHEVAPYVPESVRGEKDAEIETVVMDENNQPVLDEDGNELTEIKPIYQEIDQSKLVPLLTAALQEAITKIEELQTRLDNAGL